MAKMERPILFSSEMVRAILEGRKSQTRRVLKHQGSALDALAFREVDGNEIRDEDGNDIPCPYGKPGDSLWVRETWANLSYESGQKNAILVYRADDDGALSLPEGVKWKPSIHIPRWASRINLEITHVRVERIQDITEEDAAAEGIPHEWSGANGNGYLAEAKQLGTFTTYSARMAFPRLWDSINKKRGFGWDANPWVWCISFSKISGGERP